jgi:hypothetical protein
MAIVPANYNDDDNTKWRIISIPAICRAVILRREPDGASASSDQASLEGWERIREKSFGARTSG